MRFRVLGTLEVFDGAHWHTVPAPRWRSLLAVLLAEAGSMVPSERLVAEVWGDSPPRTVANQVYCCVGRLRRMLDDPGGRSLITHSLGYQLVVGNDDLDAHRFTTMTATGLHALRTGRPEQAAMMLSEALAMWRGPAYADVVVGPMVRASADRLDELRLTALEARIEADLACDRATPLVAELQTLTRRHPLREGLWRLYMLALHRCGRQADALTAYASVRALLHTEMGIEPCLELQQLQAVILSGHLEVGRPVEASATPSLVPRQLPAGAWPFVGRTDELHRLAQLSEESRRGRSVAVCAIDGAAGIGKTSLAVAFGHQIADRYPDGQLYVNLRGSDPGGIPVDPSDAIRGFMHALGVASPRAPAEPDAQSAMLRSAMAGKRILMLLDNARDSDQVRRLLPGTADGLVLVTSRQRLTALQATEGVRALTLDVLAAHETRELFAARLGEDRARAHPAAAQDVIDCCGNHPLAVVVAATRAAARPRLPLEEMASEIRASPSLEAFAGGDTGLDVSSVFSWSFSSISPSAAHLFRLLSLHPGPEISVAAAASLLNCPRHHTATLLGELARSHLVEESSPHRYGLHDLLRRFAQEQAGLVEDASERDAALRRLIDHYVHTAHAATELLHPHRDPADPPRLTLGAVIDTFRGEQHALDWLARERDALRTLVHHAEGAGIPIVSWLLSAATCLPATEVPH